MEKELFAELLRSVRAMKAVHRGEATPSRAWEVVRGEDGTIVRRAIDPECVRQRRQSGRDPAVAAGRAMLGLSQDQFAQMLGISVRTLHNWEQGRRKPSRAARVLLRVALRHPEIVLRGVADAD